jgi:ubiquinone/menaquinone biosynthesis C-methylase UbiE
MECEPQQSHLSPPIVHVEVSTPLVLSVQEGYARWAHIYDDDDNLLVALQTPRVQQLLGDVRGLTVADIGCGTGRHAVTMAAAGAQVTALDFSTGMLVKAQAKPGAAIVRFLRHDLTQGLPFRSETFDRVICCLVLDHLGDLVGVLRELARICRADGFILLSFMHPAMMLLGIQAQFCDPATGRKIRPASPGHQISDYVMAVVHAGLRIEHMSEHIVDEALAAGSPKARQYVGRPLLLLMRLRRTDIPGRMRSLGQASSRGLA